MSSLSDLKQNVCSSGSELHTETSIDLIKLSLITFYFLVFTIISMPLHEQQWFYRGEGNNNVIFTNKSNNRVLRLPKVRKRQYNKPLAQPKKSQCHEIEFLENVVYKILQDVQVHYKGEKMFLSKDLIGQLSNQMKGKRPDQFKDEELDESIKYGLVLPNFCKLVSPLTNHHHHFSFSVSQLQSTPTISVELRPKTCYFPEFEKEPCPEIKDKCFFCLRKLYEKIKQPESLQTKYCPRDLYSGDSYRIKRALRDLISCPQHYFSVRINDEGVFSNSVLVQRSSKDLICGSKRKFSRQVFDQVVSNHFGEKGREAFLNVLCDAVQTSVVVNNCSEIKHLPTPKHHCRRKHQNDSFSAPANARHGSSIDRHGSSMDILTFLATIHHMRYLPLRNVINLHKKVKTHLEIHEEDAERLSLEFPYNVGSWEKVTKILDSKPTNGINSVQDAFKSRTCDLQVTEAAETLRRFIIGRGFSCCSLIITLQKLDHDNFITSQQNLNKNGTIITSDGYGNSYVTSLSIVDLYKDFPTPLEKYYRREADMITFLNNHFQKMHAPKMS